MTPTPTPTTPTQDGQSCDGCGRVSLCCTEYPLEHWHGGPTLCCTCHCSSYADCDVCHPDEGCADCGHTVCRCDALCPVCGLPWDSEEERRSGRCLTCTADYYDDGGDL